MPKECKIVLKKSGYKNLTVLNLKNAVMKNNTNNEKGGVFEANISHWRGSFRLYRGQ